MGHHVTFSNTPTKRGSSVFLTRRSEGSSTSAAFDGAVASSPPPLPLDLLSVVFLLFLLFLLPPERTHSHTVTRRNLGSFWRDFVHFTAEIPRSSLGLQRACLEGQRADHPEGQLLVFHITDKL